MTFWQPSPPPPPEPPNRKRLPPRQYDRFQLVTTWATGKTDFTVQQLLAETLGIHPSWASRAEQTIIGAILAKLGFVRVQVRKELKREWRYFASYTKRRGGDKANEAGGDAPATGGDNKTID